MAMNLKIRFNEFQFSLTVGVFYKPRLDALKTADTEFFFSATPV